jgi:hypothetical protein
MNALDNYLTKFTKGFPFREVTFVTFDYSPDSGGVLT